MEWGLCPPPPPRVTAHSQQVHVCPFTPSQGSSQSLLLGGLTHLLLPGLLCHILSLGSSGRLVPLKQIQPHITRAAFLGHTHHLLIHSPLRPERPPRALSPLALSGRSLPSGLARPSRPPQGHQELPPPGAGCLPCPGEASWCQA